MTQLRETDGGFLAWSSHQQRWLPPEEFWADYVKSRGGSRWKTRSSYPPYKQVSERDLMFIELPQGICLMEFWHQRWRRAQDVRRWSPKFNEYGGCPYVFD